MPLDALMPVGIGGMIGVMGWGIHKAVIEMTCAICNTAGMENKHKVIVTDGEDAYNVCDGCWTEILRIRGLTPTDKDGDR